MSNGGKSVCSLVCMVMTEKHAICKMEGECDVVAKWKGCAKNVAFATFAFCRDVATP